MKTKSGRKGIALILVLITAMIVFMLGVSIAGLSTQEGRSSMQRSREIITRQTALAGIKYGQNLLNEDWNNPKLPPPGGKLIDNEFYPENGCYYTVTVQTHTANQCIFLARAYFKEALSGNRELWARGVEATYSRSSFHFALLGLGNPSMKRNYDSTYDYYYYTYEYPKSLSIVDAVVDGNIGTAQKYGDIRVQPKPLKKKVTIFPGGEGEGQGEGEEEEKDQEVELSIQDDAVLNMPNKPDFVKVVKEKNNITEPVQFPEPKFPYNGSKTDYNTSIAQPPGFYETLSATASRQPLTVGGSGYYYIKDCDVSSMGDGNVLFDAGGTYFIENLTARGGGTITLSSGNYYIKRLKLGNPAGEKPLTLKINVKEKKPANIIVTDEVELTGVRLNPPVKEGDDWVSNPGDLIIFGTSNCTTNKLTSVSGCFVFQNKSNTIDIKNSSVDGSLIGNVLNIEGTGQFSCHKEVMSDQAVLTKWEEQ